MKLPKRGEKGFTLIELLIVVAILGVLAAVVIPNVGRFLGRGEEEARRTEFHNVSAVVMAMMTDNALTKIPNPIKYTGAVSEAASDMTKFPDSTTTPANRGADAAFLTAASATGRNGYVLNYHQLIIDVDGDGTYDSGDGDAVKDINYVNMSSTKAYYTCEKDGTVRQWKSADTTDADNEYKY